MVSIACALGSADTGYTSVRRGMGDPSRDTTGIRPHSGSPTGTTGVADIPLTTPAADVYHAVIAVRMPIQPPAWSHHSVPPCETLKNPIASTISVISRVRNTRNVVTLTRVLQSSKYVLNTAKASRTQARSFVVSEPVSPDATVFEVSASTMKT